MDLSSFTATKKDKKEKQKEKQKRKQKEETSHESGIIDLLGFTPTTSATIQMPIIKPTKEVTNAIVLATGDTLPSEEEIRNIFYGFSVKSVDNYISFYVIDFETEADQKNALKKHCTVFKKGYLLIDRYTLEDENDAAYQPSEETNKRYLSDQGFRRYDRGDRYGSFKIELNKKTQVTAPIFEGTGMKQSIDKIEFGVKAQPQQGAISATPSSGAYIAPHLRKQMEAKQTS
uniref:Uncharacterized protein n=1 Tax=Coptotermes formosanus TaxID=36987 RepID=R4V1P1_COPFO|nr:hypothetical protein [Coptotermes formosanus]